MTPPWDPLLRSAPAKDPAGACLDGADDGIRTRDLHLGKVAL